MAYVVGAELHLVSIRGESIRLHHYPRIFDQEVEPVGRGEEGVRGFFDGSEAGEIELEKGDVGVRDNGLDVTDCGFGLGRECALLGRGGRGHALPVRGRSPCPGPRCLLLSRPLLPDRSGDVVRRVKGHAFEEAEHGVCLHEQRCWSTGDVPSRSVTNRSGLNGGSAPLSSR